MRERFGGRDVEKSDHGHVRLLRAPRAAMPPPRRRAWLRIFVVRCDLPCDPPVGGHSCNGGMIPRFECAVCGYFTLGSAAGADCKGQNLKAVTVVPASVVRP